MTASRDQRARLRAVEGGQGEARASMPWHLHPAYFRAIPRSRRGVLVCYLSALLAHADPGPAGGDGRLIVRASRPQVAELAGCTADTAKSREAELEQLGLVRRLEWGTSSRVLEIHPAPTTPMRAASADRARPLDGEGGPGDPPTSPRSADRAVNNFARSAPGQGGPGAPQGGPPNPPQGGLPDPPSGCPTYSSEKEEERSSRVCAHARGADPSGRDETSLRSDDDSGTSARVTRMVAEALERLDAAERGDPSTLRQARELRALVDARVRRMARSFGEDGALAMVEPSWARLVEAALAADRPIAYLVGVVRREAWPVGAAEGSEAAAQGRRYAREGRAAELPVRELGSRAGAAEVGVDPAALARWREARERFLGVATRDQRRRLALLGEPLTTAQAHDQARAMDRAVLESQPTEAP